MAPLISICIPAYNRADYLEKLLDSIKIQDYKNFNVIITDDSTDDTVMHLVKKYETSFEIKYYKNSPAFGMPQNWNYCIETANGAWIKIMHDDDCFATAGSLAGFAAATATDTSVIFSAYHIRDEKIKTVKSMRLKPQEADRIRQNPFMLFYSNIAGPPSVTMVRKDLNEYYDTRLRWVVDFEYYFRIISKGGFTYIPEALIDITQNDSQITNSCFRNKEVEIPDTLLLYEKYGKKLTGNIAQFRYP